MKPCCWKQFVGLSLIFLVVEAQQPTENTDACLKADENSAFDTQWCSKLSRTEGCRLGIMNLLFAAAEGDTASLKRYKDAGMNMNLADYDDRYAVHLSVAEGKLEATKFLLEEAKVIPAPKDRWGFTPLDEAVRFNRTEIKDYLTLFYASSASMR